MQEQYPLGRGDGIAGNGKEQQRKQRSSGQNPKLRPTN
jgi:hypothetical protein